MTFLKQLTGNRMIRLAFMLYALTAVLSFDKCIAGLKGSGYYFKEMIVIMPVVFMMTVLIEVWVPREMISRSLGERSGVKGIVLALVLGSVSAGPIYAAFPITKALLKKGAGVMNIVIILSAWAVIKVPMLANEARFLGGSFMLTRWMLTVVVIIAIGYVASLLVKPTQMMNDSPSKEQPTINGHLCVGCRLCMAHGEEMISIRGKKATIDYSKLNENNKTALIKAAESCPVSAFVIE